MEKVEALVLFVTIGVAMSLHMVYNVQGASTLPPEDKPLMRQFYKKFNTCENAETFVTHQVEYYWKQNKNLTAKLVKLLYADCMVNGCDASILLDGPNTEKTAPQNAGLGTFVFIVIDKIKTVLEDRCPGAVSCADILNLAARDALHLIGAPSYPVFLGRRDGVESSASWVDLPSPSISLKTGLDYFKSKGLDVQDYATLLGAHTIGQTHCNYIRDRLYNYNNTGKPDSTMDKTMLASLRKKCPSTIPKGKNDTLVYLTQDNSEYKFTNKYFKRVISKKSVLGVDQELLYGNETSQLVREYSNSFDMFKQMFAFSINRMGGLKVLTGNKGEIRKNCRIPNKN